MRDIRIYKLAKLGYETDLRNADIEAIDYLFDLLSDLKIFIINTPFDSIINFHREGFVSDIIFEYRTQRKIISMINPVPIFENMDLLKHYISCVIEDFYNIKPDNIMFR